MKLSYYVAKMSMPGLNLTTIHLIFTDIRLMSQPFISYPQIYDMNVHREKLIIHFDGQLFPFLNSVTLLAMRMLYH